MKKRTKTLGLGVFLLLLMAVPAKMGADDESDRQAALATARDNFNKWHDQIKEFRKFYHEDTEAIREALCSEDEDRIKEAVDKVAERVAGNLNNNWDAIKSRKDELVTAVQKLKSGSTQEEAAQLEQKIGKLTESVEKAAKGDASLLRGAANPRIRARIEFGKAEHVRKQGSLGCAQSEVLIEHDYCSDSRRDYCFIDCVKVSSGYCSIAEIKPNNDRAKARGRDQVDLYERGIRAKIEKVGIQGFTDKSEVFKQCLDPSDDHKLKLDTGTVETYDFCPVKSEDVTDEPEAED